MAVGYDSHYRRYDRIYQAFLEGGVPLAALKKCTKKLLHFRMKRSLLPNLYCIEAAMDAGANIGAITHQTHLPGVNPLGFFDFDVDGPDHGLDLSPFTYRVRRQGEAVLAHYWARLPDPSVPIEASYKGRDFDLCTWNTVMPGSVHESGTVYELEYLENGEWVPWDGEAFTLDMLPVVDPEKYRAIENQRITERPGTVQPLRTKPKTAKAWVSATGSETTRIKMARNYLCYYAWRSVSGKNGHDSLLVAVTNLRLFHRLDRTLALRMLKEHFNPRCTDLNGNPSPWTETELVHKWDEAGKPDAYPTLGVNHPRARAKEARMILEGEVADFLGRYTKGGGRVTPTDLRLAFIASRCGEAVEAARFGRAMSVVSGVRTTSPHGTRVYRGLSLTEAGLGLTRGVGEAA